MPVVFGMVVFIRSKHASDSIGEVVFGLFMTLWSTLFLENWKRRQATFCLHWGMEGKSGASLQVSGGGGVGVYP